VQWPVLLLLGGAVVRPGGAPLRESCGAEARPVAQLAAGAAVSIRFSLSGEAGQCFKVEAGGQSGYLLARDLQGTDSYEQARAAAPSLSTPQLVRAEMSRVRGEVPNLTLGGVLDKIETGQPKTALAVLEEKVLPAQRDHTTLALAGLAALQADQPERAVAYLEQALAVGPNPQLEELLKRARREVGADRSRQRTTTQYFELRYEGEAVSSGVAREYGEALDQEYERVAAILGCRRGERITAIVQSASAYRGSTGAAEWSGGEFDGRIRIPLLYERSRVGPQLRETFAHEIVHACLAQMGQFPAWFHEGLAQRLSGERMNSAQRSAVREALRAGRLPGLHKLGDGWSGLSAESAREAYTMALAAVEELEAWRGLDGIRSLARDPWSVRRLAEELNGRLAGR
jgi:hypothetical protein